MKQKLRHHFRKVREQISDARKFQAKKELLVWLLSAVQTPLGVLSYSSFGTELETREINKVLMDRGQLVLPRVVGGHLELFHVEKEDQLFRNSWGILEPNEKRCSPIAKRWLCLALIPGLAFDSCGNRLGYGKGFYDRLLPSFAKNFTTVGLGYREQLSPTLLATTPTDFSLTKLSLF